MVFATATAPLFGHVRGSRHHGPCRPRPRQHGASTAVPLPACRPTGCAARRTSTSDAVLGNAANTAAPEA
jgi:hypothetical protein